MGTLCYYYKMTPDQVLDLTYTQYKALSETLLESLKAEAGRGQGV